MNLRTRLTNLGFLLNRGRYRDILEKILFRVWSDTYAYCLRRDLEAPFEPPAAKMSLEVRPLEEKDIPGMFDLTAPGLTRVDIRELVCRLEHIHARIPTCYVAAAPDGKIAFMQWLMGAESNKEIQAYFNGITPILGKDEALLENAFTFLDFRGKGVMPSAMARIAERGREIGARYIMTFVEVHNTPSLKGCRKSGFSPYLMRRERWILFHQTLNFTLLPEGTLYPFEDAAVTVPGMELQKHL